MSRSDVGVNCSPIAPAPPAFPPGSKNPRERNPPSAPATRRRPPDGSSSGPTRELRSAIGEERDLHRRRLRPVELVNAAPGDAEPSRIAEGEHLPAGGRIEIGKQRREAGRPGRGIATPTAAVLAVSGSVNVRLPSELTKTRSYCWLKKVNPNGNIISRVSSSVSVTASPSGCRKPYGACSAS